MNNCMTLAGLYDRAARDLNCKELRLFLTAQASRLRMMDEAVPAVRAAYTVATQELLQNLLGFRRVRRSRSNVVRLQ